MGHWGAVAPKTNKQTNVYMLFIPCTKINQNCTISVFTHLYNF